MKHFVLASLFYLGLAALFGLLNGIFDVTYFGAFAHTHFSLLGFMAMMVFGIGYFILPRFGGTELRFPSWVTVHFWLANISLIGMVISRGLLVELGGNIYKPLFILFAVGQAVSLLMFVINIWLTLTLTTRRPAKTTGQDITQTSSRSAHAPSSVIKPTVQKVSSEAISVSAETKIADLIDAVPSIRDLLVSLGLRSLAIPEHLDRVRAMGITVGMAAARHDLDLKNLLAEIERELHLQSGDRQAAVGSGNTTSSIPTDAIAPQVLIGTVMERYPEAKAVFQKYFGAGCFDCPGQMYESIDMACRMHGVDQQIFLNELNATIRS
ncbi:MAG: DUF1858 domain-containing protein [Candidatus Zixiibacteriota bacterium]